MGRQGIQILSGIRLAGYISHFAELVKHFCPSRNGKKKELVFDCLIPGGLLFVNRHFKASHGLSQIAARSVTIKKLNRSFQWRKDAGPEVFVLSDRHA